MSVVLGAALRIVCVILSGIFGVALRIVVLSVVHILCVLVALHILVSSVIALGIKVLAVLVILTVLILKILTHFFQKSPFKRFTNSLLSAIIVLIQIFIRKGD